MGLFRKRPVPRGTPWWLRKPDPQIGRDVARMNAALMPWSRTARIAAKAADRRAERLRAEEDLQRRLEALDPAGELSRRDRAAVGQDPSRPGVPGRDADDGVS